MIPYPVRLDRVVADDPEPRYVTFINPQADNGMTVFARIALELGRRRPEIPLLLVEGRGTSEGWRGSSWTYSGLTNMNRMANTPDPRDFYKVSRVVLMPSLWRSRWAGLRRKRWPMESPCWPATGAPCPKRWVMPGLCSTSPNGSLPRAEPCRPREVAPWVAAIERLWDDSAFEARHRALAKDEARRWEGDRLGEQYEAFFRSLGQSG